MKPRIKPSIPPAPLAALTFDSEPEARRRLMNSAFCEKCGKLALQTREDAHNYIGLLLSKPGRKLKSGSFALSPYPCPFKMGFHIGRDRTAIELLKGARHD